MILTEEEGSNNRVCITQIKVKKIKLEGGLQIKGCLLNPLNIDNACMPLKSLKLTYTHTIMLHPFPLF